MTSSPEGPVPGDPEERPSDLPEPEAPQAATPPSGLSAELSAEMAAEMEVELGVDEAAGEAAAAAAAAPPVRRGRLSRAGSWTGAFLRTKRGLLLVFVLVAGIGSMVTVTSVAAIQWTETADFCGRCHTMGPELKAYAMGPHNEVSCAECHVEPGIAGWVKAKINGTKQLFQVITNTFPKPIPAPDHGDLPSTKYSCEKCHSKTSLVEQGGPVRFVLQNRYAKDEPNTKTSVALVFRPAGFGGSGPIQGVHWHIDQDVEYYSSDPQAQTMDVVKINETNGESETYIAARHIQVAEDVQPDVDAVTKGEAPRRMDCITCHNRVGHPIPGIDQTIDDGIDAGTISQGLPYIKREGSAAITPLYASFADADAAIDEISTFYETEYPLVAKTDGTSIQAAQNELKKIYRLIATPEMQVTASTYPNNLGHQTAPGCFRCHDGAHYKVVDGAVTKETIPSSCATCHTYPQVGGGQESGVVIGYRPESHSDSLWLFDHKNATSSADPTRSECGACHTRTYCQNCHNTPVAKITHDNMATNHAAVAREVGTAACAACHQRAYCAQCHSNDVLPSGGAAEAPAPSPIPSPSGGPTGVLSPAGAEPASLKWPLLMVGAP